MLMMLLLMMMMLLLLRLVMMILCIARYTGTIHATGGTVNTPVICSFHVVLLTRVGISGHVSSVAASE